MSIEEEILNKILLKREIEKPFSKIISGFEEKYRKLNLTQNKFKIRNYFNTGNGINTAREKLLSDGKIKKEWLRQYETKKGKTKIDFKGIYFFLHQDKPFYVGISKGVVGRISQHVKGHSHNNSTLAYNIGLIRFKLLHGYEYEGSRKNLNFKEEVEPVKEFLLNQNLAWTQIENDEELYLFEIYCAMNLKTLLNKFETH